MPPPAFVSDPDLIVGAYVERIRFPAVPMFSGLRLVLVYAAVAMTVTQISAAAASLAWMATEWIKFGKPSMVGLRVSDEEEFEGLDISTHGERSYEI
ncbi:hypothetical protein [Shumkonia mesophila]|uniref:hypothetical protein n=1 Tax=Shumkonia mesophila TaxID=2838854 RepID=UPI0029341333|nr:hypothetical protein [Shumkonia mesophila]